MAYKLIVPLDVSSVNASHVPLQGVLLSVKTVSSRTAMDALYVNVRKVSCIVLLKHHTMNMQLVKLYFVMFVSCYVYWYACICLTILIGEPKCESLVCDELCPFGYVIGSDDGCMTCDCTESKSSILTHSSQFMYDFFTMTWFQIHANVKQMKHVWSMRNWNGNAKKVWEWNYI